MNSLRQPGMRQSGMVLVSSLLLLVVVTLLAVSMFRSFGLDEKIAGNIREKQLALHAAESAQQYAEYWLSAGNGTSAVVCNTVVSSTVGQVCTNILTSVVANQNVAAVPWQIGGISVGVSYNLPNVTAGTLYLNPVFYISYLGTTGANQGKIYQIDAVGYGGTPSTAAVVESTYLVQASVKDLGGQ